MPKGLLRSLSRNPKRAAIEKISIPIRNLSLSVVDGAPGWGGAVPVDLPEGNILLLGAISYLQFTTSSANIISAFTGTYAIGTVPTADNDVADAGEANIVQSTTLSAATSKVSPVTRGTSGTNGVFFDNTDNSLEMNLSLIIDDASISGAATFTVNGVVHMAYMVLGDD